jgi:hypothetical protein
MNPSSAHTKKVWIVRVFEGVKPAGHSAEVLEALKSL